MSQVIIVIHVLLGLGIIGLIMIQQGKGADAGASFGTGSSGSVFGAQGAGSFLTRATATLAALFFMTSLGLAIINGHQSSTTQDLMAGQATSKQEPAIPEADVSKLSATPEIKSDEIPATPEDAATTNTPAPEPKK